jgi:hypothetical protein
MALKMFPVTEVERAQFEADKIVSYLESAFDIYATPPLLRGRTVSQDVVLLYVIADVFYVERMCPEFIVNTSQSILDLITLKVILRWEGATEALEVLAQL